MLTNVLDFIEGERGPDSYTTITEQHDRSWNTFAPAKIANDYTTLWERRSTSQQGLCQKLAYILSRLRHSFDVLASLAFQHR